jgi:hypothetical protein
MVCILFNNLAGCVKPLKFFLVTSQKSLNYDYDGFLGLSPKMIKSKKVLFTNYIIKVVSKMRSFLFN